MLHHITAAFNRGSQEAHAVEIVRSNALLGAPGPIYDIAALPGAPACDAREGLSKAIDIIYRTAAGAPGRRCWGSNSGAGAGAPTALRGAPVHIGEME